MGGTNNGDIYGAFASIVIKYDGSLRQLGARLSDALNLKSFEIETNEDPPHEEIGSAEAMGWEAWLNATPESSDSFHFRIETEHSVSEICEGRMFDLSEWLARLVRTLCKVEAFPKNPVRDLNDGIIIPFRH